MGIIQKFIGREQELDELSAVLHSPRFELIVLYGRRRIGKTELILEATKTTKRLYYLAVGEKNLERFYALCVQQYPEASKLRVDWEVLFDFLKDRVEVIIIDEFQNIVQENENVLPLFQAIVDTVLTKTNLKLFLVGSSISLMTSYLLEYKSPLYGRRTGSINLQTMSFFDLQKFFPGATMEELVEIYGFADGIPFYLTKITKEFWAWLQEELNQKRSFLKDEVDFLVRYEFTEVSTYKLILEALAHGKTTINEIKDYMKVQRTDISPYLRNLIEIGMVKRIVPLTENLHSRLGRYYLSDHFLAFWFRYVYPYLSSIEEGIFTSAVIKKEYNSYLGFVFEDIIKQFLVKENKEKNCFFPFTKVGKWWHKDKEIDFVALHDQTQEILFGECKWQDKVDAVAVLAALQEKAKFVPWHNRQRKEYYAICAKHFSRRVLTEKNVFLFDLTDLRKVN